MEPLKGTVTTFTAVKELPEGKKKLTGKVVAIVIRSDGKEIKGKASVTVMYLVEKITIEPKEATVIVGGAQPFTAKAYDTEGSDVTEEVANEITWRVEQNEKKKEGKKEIGSVNPTSGSNTTFTAVGELPQGKKNLKGKVVASFKRAVEGKAKVTVLDVQVKIIKAACDPTISSFAVWGTTRPAFYTSGSEVEVTVKGNGTTVHIRAKVDKSGDWEIKFDHIIIGSHASQGRIYTELMKFPNPVDCKIYYVVTKRGETDDAGFPVGGVRLSSCGSGKE